MKWNWAAALGAALIVALAMPAAQADSISSVEGARAKDRAGYHLNRQDREQLRRYGRNDDYGYRDGPGVGVYIGPGGYDGPYGY